MILGNDVSGYQNNPTVNNGKIDFNKMKSAGSRFVYIRLGVGFNKDKYYESNKAGAEAAGIPWGFYYVPWPVANIGTLLTAYENMVGGDWGQLPPAIDVETSGLGLGLFIEWINFTEIRWLASIAKTSADVRKKLVFYTRATHFDLYTNLKGLKEQIGLRTSLWVAHYTYSPLKLPTLPKDSWGGYLIHQYSADENRLGSTYGVASLSVDMDFFNGDEQLFSDWVGTSQSIPDDNNVPASNKVMIQNAYQLWGRTKPVLEANTERYILRSGEVYEKVGDPIYDANAKVWYQAIKIPEQIVYASNAYMKEV
jgi:GH25 family lysozyme M1 (1,4-beta-N-acetylmuramidase)